VEKQTSIRHFIILSFIYTRISCKPQWKDQDRESRAIRYMYYLLLLKPLLCSFLSLDILIINIIKLFMNHNIIDILIFDKKFVRIF